MSETVDDQFAIILAAPGARLFQGVVSSSLMATDVPRRHRRCAIGDEEDGIVSKENPPTIEAE
jgi:hypothetical protein